MPRIQILQLNLPFNQTACGTITGTALALLMQVTNAELLKIMVPASIGAAVSFVVSHFIKMFLRWAKRRRK